jgi:YVTN family beta-propeller protein
VKLRFSVLFLTILIVCCRKPDELNNTPIEIPPYAAYALRHISGEVTVTVIDMEKDSIVGIQRAATGREYLSDLALGPDSMLYLTMSDKDLDHTGKVIRIFDPGKGKIIEDVEVDLDPERIYALPNGKALIAHQLRRFIDTAFITTVFDMHSQSVKKIIKMKSILSDVPIFPSNQIYLYYAYFPRFFPKSQLIHFDPEKDTFAGSIIILEDTLSTNKMTFVTENKLYASYVNSVTVFEFPSGHTLKMIQTRKPTCDLLSLPNGKIYVAHNTGEAWQYGNYDSLSIIDVNTDEVIKTIKVCKGPISMAYSKDLNKVYVAGYLGTRISVINPDNDSVIKTIISDLANENEWGYGRIIVNR